MWILLALNEVGKEPSPFGSSIFSDYLGIFPQQYQSRDAVAINLVLVSKNPLVSFKLLVLPLLTNNSDRHWA